MRIRDFINTRFKQFSNQDNVRSIPKITDGLKDSQRKVIYGITCHGSKEIKVSQLAEMSSMKTHYEHGAVSLEGTIVGLAQNYPGSNNVNVLDPVGQFGSILDSKAGASRYIYTAPSAYFGVVFRKEDECILEYREVDGDQVEPVTYFPVLPLWAINGVIGIGTGHSVKILPRDPVDVINAIIEYIKTKKIKHEIKPAFLGWTGSVEGDESTGYTLSGKARSINTTRIRITEIPPNSGIDRVKKTLVDLIDKRDIIDYDNSSSKKGIDIVIKVPRAFGSRDIGKISSDLKLSTKVTENITLWRHDNTLHRYDRFNDALVEFVDHRLIAYEKRRVRQIEIINAEIHHIKQRMMFINVWLNLDNPSKMTDVELKRTMVAAGVDKELFSEFMMLRLTSLTRAGVEKLAKELDTKKGSKAALVNCTNTEMYVSELKEAAKTFKGLVND